MKPVLWGPFVRLWLFKTWREYFQFSYLHEAVFSAKKRYIYAEFPHGVIPMSVLVAGTLCPTMWPDFKVFGVAADSVFKIPVWRHFIAWLGSVPASAQNIKKLLQRGNVAVIVGGIAGGHGRGEGPSGSEG
jgi:2-acylglycerol O-acyltransferase 2